jgi:NAD(P)-dependent dehydrogenase (short-subunit alcohol dehydrogenase family)
MKTALITGASRGLGFALAQRLAEDGWALVIDARDRDALENAAAQLRAAGHGPVVAIAGDVADPAHRAGLVDAVAKAGRLDLVVNNASILGPSPQPALEHYPLDVFEDVLRVNVVAPLALVQGLLPQLRAARGAVVNITSDAAVEPYAGWGGYGSSKAALDQISSILAAEEGDVRVYAFDPGDMRTRMHQEAFPDEDISDRPLPETVVPVLVALLDHAPPSGRFRTGDVVGVVP